MVEEGKRAQDFDGLENQAVALERRIGKPDFVGSFKQGEKSPMNFRMYILDRKEGNLFTTSLKETTFGLENMPIKSEKIEGVILDNFGLAVFSGWKTRDALAFVKTYSKFGRERGGARNILYQGNYDEASKAYRGIFLLINEMGPGNLPSSGEFEIRKPTGNNSNSTT